MEKEDKIKETEEILEEEEKKEVTIDGDDIEL